MKNPYLQILLFSVLIFSATGSVVLFSTILFPPIIWGALLYYTLLTVTIHAILAPSLKTKSKIFTSVFMGTQGLRMMLSIAFLILYLLFSSNTSIPFIVYFLLLYLFYTGFEIYLLLSNLRTDFTKGSKRQ